MKKFSRILGGLLLVVVVFLLASVAYIKTALPDVGPPPVLTIKKTAERVERGKYLANHVSVCMDCHSTRDWSLFAGPLSGQNLGGGGEAFNSKMGFPGNFYARNITPYKLGTWTDGEIFRAVTTGVSKDDHPLFPVMPYESFAKMDPEDIYSIIAYLRTLAPVAHEVPESEADFPVSVLLHTMPAKGQPTKRPDESDKVNYGRYLVTSAACLDCHSQRDKGALVEGTEFGGGMEFNMPTGLVRSANITASNASGIGLWSEDAFVKRFKQFADSTYKPHKVTENAANTPMPWMMYSGMTDKDLRAIYAYLRTVPVKETKVVKFEPAK